MNSVVEVEDIWQQGGHPTLYLITYISTRARDRAIDLDQRTVYRKDKRGVLEEVAVFKHQIDAEIVVHEHNRVVREKKFERLHARLGDLIERVDQSMMGDPVL